MTKLPTLIFESFKKRLADLAEYRRLEKAAKTMRKLPTLSDGKRRYVTSAEYTRLSSMAKSANKPLREFLEFGGHLEKKV